MLSLPHLLCFLLFLGPFLLIVLGPVFGPELLVFRDWGQGIPDDAHPLQRNGNQDQNEEKRETKAKSKTEAVSYQRNVAPIGTHRRHPGVLHIRGYSP